LRPTFIDDYLRQHGAHGEVRVESGAWNTGWHSGSGFTQWTGSQHQTDALQRVAETSQAFHAARQRLQHTAANEPELLHRLSEAQWRLLRAETSCKFLSGAKPGSNAATKTWTRPGQFLTSYLNCNAEFHSAVPQVFNLHPSTAIQTVSCICL